MKNYLVILAAIASVAAPTSAFAVDGCKVLLCLAGNWRHIEQCVPPVKEALRDLALGRAFPTCDMNQSGPTAPPPNVLTPVPGITRAGSVPTTQDNCPPMYSLYSEENNNWIGCRYTGVISVIVNGAAWTDVFWDTSGDTSTHYYPAALAQLTSDSIDPTYANDLAAWLAANPPAPPDVPPHEGT